jgi:hypothetical protein
VITATLGINQRVYLGIQQHDDDHQKIEMKDSGNPKPQTLTNWQDVDFFPKYKSMGLEDKKLAIKVELQDLTAAYSDDSNGGDDLRGKTGKESEVPGLRFEP